MKTQDISRLIALHLTGDINSAESDQLMNWVNETPENKALFEKISQSQELSVRYSNYKNADWQKAHRAAERRLEMPLHRKRTLILRYAAVGALLIGLTSLTVLLTQPTTKTKNIQLSQEIVAGATKATLTLANGQQIPLDDDSTDQAQVIYDNVTNNSGKQQLEYDKGAAVSQEINTLTTPRGGEYSLILADGTLVHLNAGSSLSYPTVFNKSKREVTLKGEAWFEVAKDANAPFYVKTENMSIRVYGTHFNINTSVGDCEQVVLAEGRVGVTANGQAKESIMAVSQLAQYDKATRSLQLKTVDIYPYLAWKDGLFAFSDERLELILEKLSMWYDVTFVYGDRATKDLHFSGSILRSEDLEVILSALQKTLSVNFIANGREIVVSK